MSVKLDPRLPKQMNGPVINAFMQALGEVLNDADVINSYLYNISLASAQEIELENIGKIIGYPRPLMPAGFSDENTFIFGILPLAYDYQKGFSALATMVGGELVGTEQLTSAYMAISTYRRALCLMAKIKANSMTLETIDQIANLVNTDYDITWTNNQDIEIYFRNPVGFARIWVLSQLFYRVATSPQVLVSADQG